METVKLKKKKASIQKKKNFKLTWGSFCICGKTVIVQSERWKQLCQINCDVENIYLLRSREEEVKEACPAIFLDIPSMCENIENMADDNNRYMWSNMESKL